MHDKVTTAQYLAKDACNVALTLEWVSRGTKARIVLQVCRTNVNNLSAADTFQGWHSLSWTWTAAVHPTGWLITVTWHDQWIWQLDTPVRWVNNMRLSFGQTTDRPTTTTARLEPNQRQKSKLSATFTVTWLIQTFPLSRLTWGSNVRCPASEREETFPLMLPSDFSLYSNAIRSFSS